MAGSFAYVPFADTKRATVAPLRSFILPATDIAVWLHHGLLCRWAGADIPLQDIIMPDVPFPGIPERLVYRYGGTGYEYTEQELHAALRMDADFLEIAMGGQVYYDTSRVIRFIQKLSAMGVRPETQGMMMQSMPIGMKVHHVVYPLNIIPHWFTLRGLLASIWDALPEHVFLWKFLAHTKDNRPAIYLDMHSFLSWYNAPPDEVASIRDLLLSPFLTGETELGGARRKSLALRGPELEAVMPEDFIERWLKEGVGGDPGPSRTHPFR